MGEKKVWGEALGRERSEIILYYADYRLPLQELIESRARGILLGEKRKPFFEEHFTGEIFLKTLEHKIILLRRQLKRRMFPPCP